MNLPRLQSIVD